MRTISSSISSLSRKERKHLTWEQMRPGCHFNMWTTPSETNTLIQSHHVIATEPSGGTRIKSLGSIKTNFLLLFFPWSCSNGEEMGLECPVSVIFASARSLPLLKYRRGHGSCVPRCACSTVSLLLLISGGYLGKAAYSVTIKSAWNHLVYWGI